MKRVLLVLTPFTSSCVLSQCQCVYDTVRTCTSQYTSQQYRCWSEAFRLRILLADIARHHLFDVCVLALCLVETSLADRLTDHLTDR